MSCSNGSGIILVNGNRWVVPGYLSHTLEMNPGSPPPFQGGQSPGVLYRIDVAAYVIRQWRWDEWDNGKVWYLATGSTVEQRIVNVRGPISISAQFGVINNIDPVSPRGVRPTRTWQRNFVGSNGVFLYHGDHAIETINSFTISRADGLPDTGGDPPGGTPSEWILSVTGSYVASYTFSAAPAVSFVGCIPSGFSPPSSPSSPWSPPTFHPFESYDSPNEKEQPPWNPNEPPPRIGPPKLKDPPLPKLKKPGDDSDPSDPPKPPDDDKKCCCPELISVSNQIIRSLKNV